MGLGCFLCWLVGVFSSFFSIAMNNAGSGVENRL